MAAKVINSLDDLTPDQSNANKHTQRGTGMMEDSIRECGFGDSLTVDKNGRVISGNQRSDTLADLQMTDVVVVQTDGSKPVIHQRIDLDLETDVRAKKLALFSNRVGEVNLEWDVDVIRQRSDEFDLSTLFTDDEQKALLDADDAPITELDVPRPAEMVWALLLIPMEDWPKHQAAVEAMQINARWSTVVVRPKTKNDPK